MSHWPKQVTGQDWSQGGKWLPRGMNPWCPLLRKQTRVFPLIPIIYAPLWCWRRLLRVPWTARRSNQLILKEINPENSLEGLVPKLQYFGLLMWRADSLEMTLMLWKIKGKRRWQQKIRCLDSVTDSNGHEFEQTPGDGEGQGSLAC